tara:strand:+ start:147 stop:398 length:252 start_codon:yes stop_codon:yes gene_type:complete
MNPKKDFNLLGNINKGYAKMPEDTIYIPITEDDGFVLQKIIIDNISRARSLGFTETSETLTRVNIALQHALSAASEKGGQKEQ